MFARKRRPEGDESLGPSKGCAKFEGPLDTLTAHLSQTLHYGRASAALVLVKPDPRWPGMWRVYSPHGRSDLLNVSRAKDAAAAIAERGPPARNRRLFNWHTSNSPLEGPPIAQNG